MRIQLYPADSRGKANHGWLASHHSFSFGQYYNPKRMGFGALRVINDDTVAGGKGFGMHPHSNMEIISIPLQGALEHKDSIGNTSIIKTGDIQLMSAGTGILHSEYNHNSDIPVHFLQIWILPHTQNVCPRYDQKNISDFLKDNTLCQILSPYPNEQGVWIYQNAWMHMGVLSKNTSIDYTVKNNKENGVFIIVIEGELSIHEVSMKQSDAVEITGIDTITIQTISDTTVLIIEVPLKA